jgi:phage terminase Nu1 subunit (DNA packaging protein)
MASVRQLAKAIGKSEALVRRYKTEGTFPAVKKNGRWQFDIDECVEIYKKLPDNRRKDGATRGEDLKEKKPEPKPQKKGGHAIPALEVSQARERYWKAQKVELEYREREGELVEAKEVRRLFKDAAVAVRTKVMGVPSRLKQRVEVPKDVDELLRELLRESLEEMAKGNFK